MRNVVTMVNFNNNVIVEVKKDNNFINRWKELGFIQSTKLVKFKKCS